MDKDEKCPYCGAKENVIGKQVGNAYVVPNKFVTWGGQILYHIICLKCGTVIRSYVKNPDDLVIRKKNENE